MHKELSAGIGYFIQGWQLIGQKGLRRFVILPIFINILLLSAIFWIALSQLSLFTAWFVDVMPDWLDWLSSVILVLAIIMILLVFYFIFTTLAGFISAPFNGLLSEKVEKMLTGEDFSTGNMWDFVKDIPRMLKREWQKLCYSLPRLLFLFLLGFVPALGQTIAPVLMFIFTAWMLAIQYCDYPFDNHKIPFRIMRDQLAQKPVLNTTFGSLVALCAFVPLVNFLIIPVAVCGATAMWVEQYRTKLPDTQVNKTNQSNEITILK
ncbi:sulfate transporter CysZ [Volucribacter amazonae]|uniref:Sulfate transporter CysZ n=1 Tax=Volucribacter amazonae TaxID=256731 RepID=A0A9X4PCB3_9PAST|nr:sulfate transporter CysZ [Volucribacter amazonae]MDG6894756.1 sulfate transporter CysZ [Volucribacter amazonae]